MGWPWRFGHQKLARTHAVFSICNVESSRSHAWFSLGSLERPGTLACATLSSVEQPRTLARFSRGIVEQSRTLAMVSNYSESTQGRSARWHGLSRKCSFVSRYPIMADGLPRKWWRQFGTSAGSVSTGTAKGLSSISSIDLAFVSTIVATILGGIAFLLDFPEPCSIVWDECKKNPKSLKLFGEDISKALWWDGHIDDYCASVTLSVKGSNGNGTVYGRFLRDGEGNWLPISIACRRNDSNEVVGYLCDSMNRAAMKRMSLDDSFVNLSQGSRCGFLGVGVINEAIVRGFCRPKGYNVANAEADDGVLGACGMTSGLIQFPILLSPRSASKVSKLLKEFGPDLIKICESNEEVAKDADILFIGLSADVGREVLPQLPFQHEPLLVNLIPTISDSELSKLCGVPAEKRVKAIPFPPVALHEGATVVCPPEPTVCSLFNLLGNSVPIEHEDKLKVMYAASALMGPFYQTVVSAASWLHSHGIPEEQAAAFAAGFHRCVSADLIGKKSISELQNLVKEQTPGGLNEEAVRRMSAAGNYNAQARAMDAIYHRVKGDSLPFPESKQD